MGTKGHGTYVKAYADVWMHPKTLRLADALTALGVPRRWARREAVGQLLQLAGWCLTNTHDGRVDHLTPELFATVVGWDEPRKAPALQLAWRNSGFLDVLTSGEVRLHEFEVYAEDVLDRRAEAARKREKYRQARQAERSAEISAESPRRKAGDLRGEVPEISAESPSFTHARATRASGNGNGNGISPPNPPTAITAPPNPLGGGAPQTADPGKPSADPADPVLAAWNAGRARRGLPPLPDPEGLAEARAVLALAAPGDEPAQVELVTAYLGLDGDDWLRERGWGPSFLRTRIDGLLVDRTERMRRKAPVAPEAAVVLPTVLGATWDELRPYARPASQPFTAAEEERIAAELAARRNSAVVPPPPRWRPPVAVGADRDTSHAETAQ
ncbi:MAG: hypothetical protein EKK55_16860 [Rhodocyclaceae bacterium]|nr:MAG: hypothetical protein EKK55_16860 [Rhodocyclaceae bacterium]